MHPNCRKSHSEGTHQSQNTRQLLQNIFRHVVTSRKSPPPFWSITARLVTLLHPRPVTTLLATIFTILPSQLLCRPPSGASDHARPRYWCHKLHVHAPGGAPVLGVGPCGAVAKGPTRRTDPSRPTRPHSAHITRVPWLVNATPSPHQTPPCGPPTRRTRVRDAGDHSRHTPSKHTYTCQICLQRHTSLYLSTSTGRDSGAVITNKSRSPLSRLAPPFVLPFHALAGT